ncbi:MAG: GNAT family N-acetyltransferase [Janthinobacterium lividum]
MTLIHTPRLELLPATAELMRLEISDSFTLGMRLNAVVPKNWPPEEVKDVLEYFAAQMDAGVTGDGWGIYYWIALSDSGDPRTLVGSGGFMSKPSGESTVEIGYGTLTQFQGRGYATEAVGGLVEFALSQESTLGIFADALPENAASVRVLLKNGFLEVGEGGEQGTRRFEYQRVSE